MTAKGIIARELTQKECPWLKRNLSKGETVYRYSNFTYGCIGEDGVAVSDKPNNENPFYEIPQDSVEWEE